MAYNAFQVYDQKKIIKTMIKNVLWLNSNEKFVMFTSVDKHFVNR